MQRRKERRSGGRWRIQTMRHRPTHAITDQTNAHIDHRAPVDDTDAVVWWEAALQPRMSPVATYAISTLISTLSGPWLPSSPSAADATLFADYVDRGNTILSVVRFLSPYRILWGQNPFWSPLAMGLKIFCPHMGTKNHSVVIAMLHQYYADLPRSKTNNIPFSMFRVYLQLGLIRFHPHAEMLGVSNQMHRS